MKKLNLKKTLTLSLTPLLGIACGQAPQNSVMTNPAYMALAGTWRVTQTACSNGSSYVGMLSNGAATFTFSGSNAALALTDNLNRREVYNFLVSPSNTVAPTPQNNPYGTNPGINPYGNTPYPGSVYPTGFGITLQSMGTPSCSANGGAASTCSLSPAPSIWNLTVNLAGNAGTIPGNSYMPAGAAAILTGTNDVICGGAANSQITIMKTN